MMMRLFAALLMCLLVALPLHAERGSETESRATVDTVSKTAAKETAEMEARPKTAVFPFELSVPALHPDDLMFGTTVSDADLARVKLVTDELRKQLAQSDAYDVVDLTPIEADIEAASPIGDCNGCDTDLAQKVGASLAILPTLQKSSDTLLNMTIAVKDVAKDRLIKSEMVVIQGNTDEAWLRGVRWLLKRKFDVTLVKEASR